MIKTILITAILFGVIIFIHELGHFIMAKVNGIKVNEFALGMGPAIFKLKKGETLYALRVFPIGGYVSMEGEDAESDDENAFSKKKVWGRIGVVVAGAIMNLILGFLVMVILTCMQPKIGTTVVAEFSENPTSATTGLQVGDKIEKVNGRKVLIENDIAYGIATDKDGNVDMVVKRNGQKINLDNVEFRLAKNENGQQYIEFDFKVESENKSFFNVLEYSFFKTVSTAKTVWYSLIDLITGKASFNDLSGPIGVGNAVGQASSMGIDGVLAMLAFLSINIGVFNLLPLPALDGGRLVFLLIEAVRGKPINQKYEGYVHTIGFMLLILLMIVVTVNDIFKLF